ncbi:MAG: hypothetical protein HY718_02895 [Planctomycetes bacterium]|nr:hypothetical protein [Planctomycetota bacterium]
MAKSKYSPALFEVINRQRNASKLSVPKWWKRLGTASEQPPARAAETPAMPPTATEPAQPPTASRPDAPNWPAATEPVSASESQVLLGPPEEQPRPPVFRVESGLVRISLNPVQASVVGGILLVLLIVGFQLGRGFSGPAVGQGANDSLSDVLAGKPNPSVLESPDRMGPPPTGSGGEATARTGGTTAAGQSEGLTPGLHYVVLDTYNAGHRKSAEHVQQWLASTHGIQTMLYQTKDNDLCLVSRAGFDFSVAGQRDQCERLAAQVKALGKDCRKELGQAGLTVYGFASPLIQKR